MQGWPEVRIEVDASEVEQHEAWLFEAGALSVTLSDALDSPVAGVFEPLPGETPLWPGVRLTGLFDQRDSTEQVHRALVNASRACNLAAPEYQLSRREDEVWERSWMRDFRPMSFGPRLWICPSHCEPIDPDAVNLRLDPGLAFGTGTHATTALCLEWLAERLTGLDSIDVPGVQQPPSVPHEPGINGPTVIDYGCGSGVLGIAALLLGARAVHATDIDEQALQATRLNAESNGVTTRLQLARVDQFEPIVADVLLANILFQPLMTLADAFARHVRPGGKLVLSGIRNEQCDALHRRYSRSFDFESGRRRDGWALMVATRRSDEI